MEGLIARGRPVPIGPAKPRKERGSIARRRAQIGVFGAETYERTLSTENVEVGPYPQRVSPALYLAVTGTRITTPPMTSPTLKSLRGLSL
jgi:hypothetical protein